MLLLLDNKTKDVYLIRRGGEWFGVGAPRGRRVRCVYFWRQIGGYKDPWGSEASTTFICGYFCSVFVIYLAKDDFVFNFLPSVSYVLLRTCPNQCVVCGPRHPTERTCLFRQSFLRGQLLLLPRRILFLPSCVRRRVRSSQGRVRVYL